MIVPAPAMMSAKDRRVCRADIEDQLVVADPIDRPDGGRRIRGELVRYDDVGRHRYGRSALAAFREPGGSIEQVSSQSDLPTP